MSCGDPGQTIIIILSIGALKDEWIVTLAKFSSFFDKADSFCDFVCFPVY